MGGLPSYGAVLIPGSGKEVYDNIRNFNVSAGFGVMLVDTPSDDNRITLDDQGNPVLTYALSEDDKKRFRTGVALGIRMMFLAGAKKVIIPSNENFLNQPDFDPMRGVYLTDISQADLVEQYLDFIPNRTLLTAAHIQAADKIGPSPRYRGSLDTATGVECDHSRGSAQSIRDGQQHLSDLGGSEPHAVHLYVRQGSLPPFLNG